jgi:predicted ATPase/class 3 adenylate cyclase/tetratricopeptide (TPR) repeat protein/DNA-binding CsgD family transcriptional regulator
MSPARLFGLACSWVALMAEPRTRTVTFLLTDVEGSTALWERDPVAMRQALACHDAVLADGISAHSGTIVKSRGEGDSVFAVFDGVGNALAAAVAIQHSLHDVHWPTASPLLVRMALHTGEAQWRDGDYFGPVVNRCSRLRSAAHGGQILLSQAAADLVRDGLVDGIELLALGEHRLRDLARPEPVFQAVQPMLPSDFPPLLSLDAHLNNLPVELTSFIGREREVAEVRRLLTTTRLLTLTGSGGVGKTRLSQQVAGHLLPSYPDGVWLVELAALGDPGLVAQAIASALGIREQPGRALEQTLVDVLRPRASLLLLDNCEHLIAACAALAEGLLRASPRLTVLATSREPLVIAGETVWRVPPLTLPEAPSPGAADDATSSLAQSEAVRLFVERARAAFPAFALTDQNAPAVARICRRLDGIALAIELAAARMRGLQPEQVAARLDDHLRLLTGGSRTALPRQQTLRAMVDWSHDLLSEPERVLFRRLSVFAGGWTLEAAERVCSGDDLPTEDVLGLLLQLVDRSLVLVGESTGSAGSTERRYGLLETLRQYAAESLRDTGEESSVKARHLAWCTDLVQESASVLDGTSSVMPIQHLLSLEAEHDNLRTALRWSLSPAAPTSAALAGQGLAGSVWLFWWMRTHLTEGRGWLESALAIPNADDEAGRHTRAKMLVGASFMEGTLRRHDRAAVLAQKARALLRPGEGATLVGLSLTVSGLALEERGDMAGAAACYTESQTVQRRAGFSWTNGWLLGHLGRVAMVTGDYERAATLLEESLRILEQYHDRQGASWSYQYLARVMERRGDHERATDLFEEALAAARDVGDRAGMAWSLGNLARTLRARGDDAQASQMFEESLRLSRETGDWWGAAWVLGNLGRAARDRRDYQRATAYFEESLVLCRELGSQERRVAYVLRELGVVANALGQPERAARLFGAAQALQEAAARPLAPADRMEHERHIGDVRAALGRQRCDAAWAHGRALTLDLAIEYALSAPAASRTSECEPVSAPSTMSSTHSVPVGPTSSPLSAREHEVAMLLTRGLSNQQIAEELVISNRTASTHVSHILNKLGLANRWEIAAWAKEHLLTAQ